MKIRLPVVIAIVVLLIAGSSVYVVDEGRTAIVLQFGRIVKSDVGPGLHFRIPLVQQVLRFDRRLLTFDSAPERYLTSEKKDVNVDFFVKWRISDPSNYYKAVGGDEARAQQRLGQIVKEGLRTAINSRTLQDLVSGARADLTSMLVAESSKGTEGLGIRIDDIRIKRIDLPEEGDVLASVYRRMSAERKQVAAELRAEGQEKAESIRADADRQVQVLKADANRDADKLRGQGDAEASRIYADAYGKDPEFFAFYRSLQAYQRAFATPDGVMVLDPKSEFLQYLQNSGK